MALTRRLSGGAGLRSRRPPPRQSPISYLLNWSTFTPPYWSSFAPPLTFFMQKTQEVAGNECAQAVSNNDYRVVAASVRTAVAGQKTQGRYVPLHDFGPGCGVFWRRAQVGINVKDRPQNLAAVPH